MHFYYTCRQCGESQGSKGTCIHCGEHEDAVMKHEQYIEAEAKLFMRQFEKDCEKMFKRKPNECGHSCDSCPDEAKCVMFSKKREEEKCKGCLLCEYTKRDFKRSII